MNRKMLKDICNFTIVALLLEAFLLLLYFLLKANYILLLLELLQAPALLLYLFPWGWHTEWPFWVVNIIYAVAINGGVGGWIFWHWNNKKDVLKDGCNSRKVFIWKACFLLSVLYNWILLLNVKYLELYNGVYFFPRTILSILTKIVPLQDDNGLALIIPVFWLSIIINTVLLIIFERIISKAITHLKLKD